MAAIALLYFSEGVPFGLINNALSVYFRVKKISLEEIGLLSILGLAWSLKLLWAPLVDRFGRRYFWIVPAQLAIAGFTALLAVFDPVGDKTWFWILLAGICLFSATQDIAADAYTIDILEEKELGPANGIRSAAYRVALVAAGGLFVVAGDWIGWGAGFIGAAAAMVLLAFAVASFPAFHRGRPAADCPPSFGKQWAGPIRLLFRLPNFGAAAGFILTFKCGEAMLVAMANPFWIDRGYTPAQIGFVVGSLGTLASIAGAIGGGSLTARWGIVKALWILGFVQAAAGLGYFLSSFPCAPFFSIYFAALLESLAIGLATAAFLSFLMKLCDKRFSATHYAFLSTLFGLGRSAAGVLGGYAAAALGYPTFFFATIVIGVIPLFLISFLKPTLSGDPESVSAGVRAR
jgi:MFS transporter, PAT family, beta-lactamase induction signal transducer AmpG